MNDIKQLLKDGKINKFEYDCYVLFGLNELGRAFISNAIESLFLEPAEGMQIDHTYAWHDGRRSVWREIKLAIVKINQLLKDEEHDRRNTSVGGFTEHTTTVRLSASGTIPFGNVE